MPGRGVRRPGLPAALLRARRRRPGRGRQPAPEALRLSGAASAGRDLAERCPRRTCTCTSPGRCGTRRWSSWPRATASCCPTRWSRTGRRSCRRPTRRAGSASSGSTTSPARCCAPRTTYAGWCARPPRTTSRDGGRWLEIQVDPSGYAARFGGITAFTDLVLDAVRDASATTGLGMAVVIAANRTRHPLDARTLARLAAQYAGRGVVGFGLSNDERRGTHRATSRRPSRSPSGPGCCWPRTAASCSGRRASGVCLDELHADRLGHGVRVGRGPGAARPGRRGRASPLEVCPVSNVALGVYTDLTSVPLPELLAAGATVALGADDPLLFGSRLAGQYATMRAAHDLTDDAARRAGPDVGARPRGRPRTCEADAARRHRRLAGASTLPGWAHDATTTGGRPTQPAGRRPASRRSRALRARRPASRASSRPTGAAAAAARPARTAQQLRPARSRTGSSRTASSRTASRRTASRPTATAAARLRRRPPAGAPRRWCSASSAWPAS